MLYRPYTYVIEFSSFLNKKFKEYVCQHPKMSISAGIVLVRPEIPVSFAVELAEKALEQSKQRGKNAITLFGETVSWSQFQELQGIKKTLTEWLGKKYISKTMLYTLTQFIDSAKLEKNILNKKEISFPELNHLKWRSSLRYSFARNIGSALKDEEKTNALPETEIILLWIEQI